MKRKRMSNAISVAVIGCVARMVQAQSTISTLTSFNPVGTGTSPASGIVADASGDLFGTTTAGGIYGDGTLFELPAGSHTLTTLINFNGTAGNSPHGQLTIDSAGNLYGTTTYGGANGVGTLFEIPGSNRATISTLVSFSKAIGTFPLTGVTLDSSGNLYGTTTMGGDGNAGTVYQVSGSKLSTFNVLTSFTNGGGPALGGLTFDASGNLYGTRSNGSSGDGSVFELSGSGLSTFTTLKSFDGSDGVDPAQTLLLGPDGNLYGSTRSGSGFTGNAGTVFQLSGPGFQTFTELYHFSSGALASPLIADAAGNLYAASYGGSGDTPMITAGGVLEFSGTNYSTLSSVQNLNNASLSGPAGSLYNDASGKLYGTAAAGGSNSAGGIYQISGSGFVPYLAPLVLTQGAIANIVGSSNSRSIAYTAISLGLNAQLIFELTGFPLETFTVESHDVSFSTGSTVNLNNNDFDLKAIPGNSPQITLQGFPTYTNLGTATTAVAMGYNNGKWNGSTGFISSSAANDTTHLTAVGVIQNNQSGTAIYSSSNLFQGTIPGAGDILLKYTYYGDANLDGMVDGSDYSLTDAGFISHGALTGWYYGDFNYDGIVDGSDYTLIDNSFNQQGAAFTAALAMQTTQIAANVPEPILSGLISLTAVAFLGRSRSRKISV